jgi:hypothetical protein
LKELCCDDNQLTSLPALNNHLREIYFSNNRLTSLPPLNAHLRKMYCGNNRLTHLPPLPENLEILYCNNNRLNYLPDLNDKLETLWCLDNPICEIILNDNLSITKKQAQMVNRFRWLYYSLKFKKRLRDWLWIRVREPKIREKYHPRYLDNLDEDADLDEILENWIR